MIDLLVCKFMSDAICVPVYKFKSSPRSRSSYKLTNKPTNARKHLCAQQQQTHHEKRLDKLMILTLTLKTENLSPAEIVFVYLLTRASPLRHIHVSVRCLFK